MPVEPVPHVATLPAYAVPKPGDASNEVIHQLAQNESALPPCEAAQAAAREAASSAHRYADPDCAALREAIAEVEGVDGARIFCGAGSLELIALVARAFLGPGRTAVINALGYPYFRIAVLSVGADARLAPERDCRADVDAMLAAVDAATRVVFLANPNNPTGTLLAPAEIDRLRDGLPGHVLLVLDGAYLEFVDDRHRRHALRLAESRTDTVVLRTFSKIHALASLRVGWAYGPGPVLDPLRRLQAPNSVSGIAQAAAAAAIRDAAFVARHRETNARNRARLSAGLEGMGLAVVPSHTNFVLVDFGGADAAARADRRLRGDGIGVRSMHARDLDGRLRIGVGDEAGVAAVLASLGRLESGGRLP